MARSPVRVSETEPARIFERVAAELVSGGWLTIRMGSKCLYRPEGAAAADRYGRNVRHGGAGYSQRELSVKPIGRRSRAFGSSRPFRRHIDRTANAHQRRVVGAADGMRAQIIGHRGCGAEPLSAVAAFHVGE